MAKEDKSVPFATKGAEVPTSTSSSADIAAFLKAAQQSVSKPNSGHKGRLIFALDATMSRQPTWDIACHLQADMFHSAAQIGGLEIQLVYFRGFEECRASKWADNPARLSGMMSGLRCQGGRTQIRKVLAHCMNETQRQKVQAVVYIGDCMEEEVDLLCERAGELGMRGVPLFMFQEGHDPLAEQAFREMARLSKGVYHRFDNSSASILKELLSAVAAFSAGGRAALEDMSGKGHKGARVLISHLR
ncbi:VWA domain-containing protein [Rhodobacteraceae bacterium RKSG542]|uniref:VWA domain-containing protein n=1 Tax=Pseudovibrio flavus TaxID=2529854 RepID=UPI0012BD5D11|nr:VWA domain-containing protein [Pseudovibrio flavus]MTI16401.1 VWA domain-containing protein [Pseudovibrio flavus]